MDKFAQLLTTNGKDLASKRWTLIYRSSRDGLNRTSFVDKVHNKSHVICFIYEQHEKMITFNESEIRRNVFGGYTSTGWEKKENYGENLSEDQDAFVFNIRSFGGYDPEIFNVKPNMSKRALRYAMNGYCIFGMDKVICIKANGDVETLSAWSESKVYEPFPNKCHFMGGGTDDLGKVIELEVYQLS